MTKTQVVTLRASSAVAVPTTEYGVFDTAKKTSTATATTANKLTDSAGGFVTLGVAVGDIVKDTTTGKWARVTNVDSATALSLSADIFTNGDGYILYPGLGFKLNDKYTELEVSLNITAAATDVGDTLDVYIDTSFDGGLTFVNIGHFTQAVGTGGAKSYIMAFKSNPAAAGNSVDATAQQAAGASLQMGFGDRIQFRTTTVDAGTQNLSYTYSLKAFLK